MSKHSSLFSSSIIDKEKHYAILIPEIDILDDDNAPIFGVSIYLKLNNCKQLSADIRNDNLKKQQNITTTSSNICNLISLQLFNKLIKRDLFH
jgi:hypothetical protein